MGYSRSEAGAADAAAAFFGVNTGAVAVREKVERAGAGGVEGVAGESSMREAGRMAAASFLAFFIADLESVGGSDGGIDEDMV